MRPRRPAKVATAAAFLEIWIESIRFLRSVPECRKPVNSASAGMVPSCLCRRRLSSAARRNCLHPARHSPRNATKRPVTLKTGRPTVTVNSFSHLLLVEIPRPPMRFQLLNYLLRQSAPVPQCAILFDVADGAHSRDDR